MSKHYVFEFGSNWAGNLMSEELTCLRWDAFDVYCNEARNYDEFDEDIARDVFANLFGCGNWQDLRIHLESARDEIKQPIIDKLRKLVGPYGAVYARVLLAQQK